MPIGPIPTISRFIGVVEQKQTQTLLRLVDILATFSIRKEKEIFTVLSHL